MRLNLIATDGSGKTFHVQRNIEHLGEIKFQKKLKRWIPDGQLNRVLGKDAQDFGSVEEAAEVLTTILLSSES